MEQRLKDRMIYISKQIFKLSRNELYLSMRFLDIALDELSYELYLSTTSLGTDGQKILYNPNHMVRLYRDDMVLVNRSYLHMLLHCMFRHMLVNDDVDYEIWNIACDIAVESIIDELKVKCIHLTVSDYRQEIYDKIREEVKVLSAEGVYYVLKKMKLSYKEIKELEKEFVVCDHSIWEKLRDRPKDNGESNTNSNDDNSDNEDENNENQGKDESGRNNNRNPHGDLNSDKKENEEENKTNSYSSSENSEDNTDSRENHKTGMESNYGEDSVVDLTMSVERREYLKKSWENISEKVELNLEITYSEDVGALNKALKVQNREKYDYREFLRKFAIPSEEIQVDLDSFDYVFYHYGLTNHNNMPFIEPLEYKELSRIEEFVIVIDTSASCSGELIKRFLEESYHILTSSQSFAKKVNLYIIQCDDKVQSFAKITKEEELREYINNIEVLGFGGTDFRPAFAFVNGLIEKGEFNKLKGMLYFTDGYGIYPKKRPSYDVAFVFIDDFYTDAKVPSWAMKLLITPGGLMDEHQKSKGRD